MQSCIMHAVWSVFDKMVELCAAVFALSVISVFLLCIVISRAGTDLISLLILLFFVFLLFLLG